MARKKKQAATRWVCQACGSETRGWYGKCPDCGAWNTIVEELDPARPTANDRVVLTTATTAEVVPSTAASSRTHRERVARRSCGLTEIDRVLGGGLVPGSVVLLGGPPGIGKSTLLLQASAGLARGAGVVLYASGEESVDQVGARAARLEAAHENLLLLAETRVETILEAATARAPALAAVIVDSVQTVYSDVTDGLPGNVTQIRAVTSQLVSFAKRHAVPVIVVGHVTKDGQLAGPRLLEHLVDAVLSFEGDEERATRLLRAVKNRFGSTQELGVFEMCGHGLREIHNPSEAFLQGERRETPVVGACVTASLEGSRPLLLEIQALLAASFGNPRRTCVGLDPQRLAMLMAVLDRHGGLFVLDHDVFVNVAGGMRLSEPASDLAALLAVASSHLRRPLPPGLVAFGEIGLTGELRAVPRTEARLSEVARLGFRQVLLPRARVRARARRDAVDERGVELLRASTVAEALECCFGDLVQRPAHEPARASAGRGETRAQGRPAASARAGQ